MKLLVTIILMILSQSVFSEGKYIAIESKITKIGTTAGNGESFWVIATGGTGSCVANIIYFPREAAGTEKVYDRAYAAALSALAAGKKVNIYNYVDESCSKAAAIEILAN